MRNKNKNWPFLTLLTVLNAALLCTTVVTYLVTNNLYLFLAQAVVVLVLVGFTLWRVATSRRKENVKSVVADTESSYGTAPTGEDKKSWNTNW